MIDQQTGIDDGQPTQDDWFGQNAPPATTSSPATGGVTGNPTAGVDPSAAGGGAEPPVTDPRDPAQVKAWFQWRAGQPGADPYLSQPGGVDYYTTQTLSKPDGLTDRNYWTNKSTLASAGGAVGAPGGSGGGQGYGFGDFAKGFDEQFHAPSIDQMRGTPGYQFALGEGVKALDTSAAAKGTVLSGGQQKNILQYATGLADQTGQQAYNNALGEYMNKYNIFRNNQNDVFGRFDTLSKSGQNAANNATS